MKPRKIRRYADSMGCIPGAGPAGLATGHRCHGPNGTGNRAGQQATLSYGTIGFVSEHRVRLTDDDLALIIAALKSRAAMTRGPRRHRVERLAARLAEGKRGNPKWILGEDEQSHELVDELG